MGSELHSFDDNHWTPLMCSVHSGSFQTAEFLIKLDAAAASESCDNEGNTALHIAARHNEEEIVKLLLDNQCIVVLNNEGQSFLGVAMQHNCGDVVMRAVKHRRYCSLIIVIIIIIIIIAIIIIIIIIIVVVVVCVEGD